MPAGYYTIQDTLVLSGSKSLRIEASSTTFSIQSTQSFGNLSEYTEVSSGSPASGTIGLWVYCESGAITSITLRIGSNSSNYTEVAGVKTYTDAHDTQDGWNYFVFRLKNGTTTGNPNWESVSYIRIDFTGLANSVILVDLLSIGKGNHIGLNILGGRRTMLSEEKQNY